MFVPQTLPCTADPDHQQSFGSCCHTNLNYTNILTSSGYFATLQLWGLFFFVLSLVILHSKIIKLNVLIITFNFIYTHFTYVDG